MTLLIKLTKKFDFTKGKQWIIWKQSLEFYLKATVIQKRTTNVRVATLMPTILAYEATTIFNSFSLKGTEKKDLKTVITKTV